MFDVVTDIGLSWGDFARVEPELEAMVRQRFAAHEHHVLATIRPDGSPRVSGTNVMLGDETLWIGSMPGSSRTADLRRDPRCALHSNPFNADLPRGEGDIRLSAYARELEANSVARLWHQAFPDQVDDPLTGAYFELRPREVEIVEVDGDQMVIRRWNPSSGAVTITKRQ